jgi:GTP-binding protein of the ras superfamily involved in termination of M-phase
MADLNRGGASSSSSSSSRSRTHSLASNSSSTADAGVRSQQAARGGGRSRSDSQWSSTSNSNAAHEPAAMPDRQSVIVKCGLIGDAQIGKTSLMVRYVEGSFNEVCRCRASMEY